MANDRAIVSFRVSSEEYNLLEAAANAANESLSEFVRKASLLRAGGGMPMRLMANTSFIAPLTQTKITVPVPFMQPEITIPVPSSSTPRSVVQDEYVRTV